MRALSRAKIYIDETPGVTVMEMKAKARRLRMEQHLDIVFIDYIQLMRTGGRFENRNQEMSFISRSLKELAKELRIPVVGISQLSRAPEKGRREPKPQLSDLRESGAIEQDADVVIFIFRPEYYHPGRREPHGPGRGHRRQAEERPDRERSTWPSSGNTPDSPRWSTPLRRHDHDPRPARFAPFTSFSTQLGEVGLLMSRTFRNIFRRPFERSIFLQQLEEIGAGSLPVVSLTAAFGGLVFALQTYIGFHRYIGQGSEAYGGPIISLGLGKELIPILVGLMVSGRVGSAMAAEIGTMRITEQVDALFSLGADPNRYLVVPRDLACVLMLPCLTLYGDFIGIACGFIYNIYVMGVNRVIYLRNTLLYLELWDVTSGLIKALDLRGPDRGHRLLAGAEDRGRGRGRRPGHDEDRGHRQHRHPHRELLPEQGPAFNAVRR